MNWREFISGKIGIQLLLAFAFGVVFLLLLLILAMTVKDVTPFQEFVFRVILSLAAAGVGAVIPGLLGVDMGTRGLQIRSTGALALFVLVFFVNPASLAVQ